MSNEELDEIEGRLLEAMADLNGGNAFKVGKWEQRYIEDVERLVVIARDFINANLHV